MIGAILGVVLGPLLGLAVALVGIIGGASLWLLLLAPLGGLAIGPIAGFLFPGPAIYLFDHTSVFGKPLAVWLMDLVD